MTNKASAIIKWCSLAVMVISFLLLMRALPMDQITKALGQWTGSLGVWGPVVLALVYVAATVFLVPGSLLTLAAGAIFGLWIGFITASFGSVIGASLAFLISRYLARSKVKKMAKANRNFGAIDEAINEGGWKIVALLRFSPAIPFNLQNYMFGLTNIKFWQYLLTSWIAMIPGTFMYVYLGYAASTAASGDGKSVGEWALLAVGLLATIAVTVYVTYLAKNKLNDKTEVKDPDRADDSEQDANTAQPKPWKPYAFGLAAVAMLALAIFAQFQKKAMASHLTSAAGGLPAVTMAESYSDKPDKPDKPDGSTFDHGTCSKVFDQFVVEGGWVDYAGIKQERQLLEDDITQLKQAPFEDLSRDQKLALLINAYNAFTLKFIADHYPIKSIKDIPAAERWDAKRWTVGSNQSSLSQIEHEQIRPNFKLFYSLCVNRLRHTPYGVSKIKISVIIPMCNNKS
jgi:uncharacterized membrane protein YdjX (TVP38/TMEM64 family)